MIKDYSSFKQDFDFDSFINESMVYLSPDFRKSIAKIDSPISQKLLDLQGVDIKDDISFIDLSDIEGMFTFKTMKNFKKAFDNTVQIAIKWNSPLKDVYPAIGTDFRTTNKLVDGLFKGDDDAIVQSRNPYKIGRFINSVFPGQFTNKEVEDFTNKYKAIQLGAKERFEVVEGDEIAHWYKADNYYELKNSLGSSCMKYAPDSYFKIFTKNPEFCKLVCLIKEDKLVGRALLWKPKSIQKVRRDYTKPDEPVSFEWFMDRQYTTSEAYVELFRKYADEMGWAYKTTNSIGNVREVTLKGTTFICDMQIQLKKDTYRQFPYMDTFKKYDPQSYSLFNDEDNSEGGFYMLTSTGGGYEETGRSDDDDDYVWSDYHGENIDRDDAVWSDFYDTYLYIDEATEVTSGSRRRRGWYPQDAEELRWDGWNEEYIHEEDALYSEEYDYYLLESEAVSVVNNIEENGDCNEDMYLVHERDHDFLKYSQLEGTLWLDTLRKEFDNYDVHIGIMKSALYIDPDTTMMQFSERVWRPVNFSVTIHTSSRFKILARIKGDDVWLSTEDMEILDLEDWTEEKETDKISYSQSLVENGVINELIEVLSKKTKENKPHEQTHFEKKRLEQLIKIQNGEFPDYSI
jgi:hypothetical protein